MLSLIMLFFILLVLVMIISTPYSLRYDLVTTESFLAKDTSSFLMKW